MTRTRDIFGRGKEHFEELINPANISLDVKALSFLLVDRRMLKKLMMEKELRETQHFVRI